MIPLTVKRLDGTDGKPRASGDDPKIWTNPLAIFK